MADFLQPYNEKRNFNRTGEPKGTLRKRKKTGALSFVVQKHSATRLHYDFRLELDGVLKSWAVTKGPSFAPQDKRLAVRTEDHPLSYGGFEGVIPENQYGAGPVIIWDEGHWEPHGDPHRGLEKGHLSFTLYGKRMKGDWSLILMRGKEQKRENWLLIKTQDEYALSQEEAGAYLDIENTSLHSRLTVEELGGMREQPEKPPEKPRARGKRDNRKTEAVKPGRLAKKYPDVALATLVEFPPSGKNWWHEIKYDGYRVLCFIENGHVSVMTRGHQDWTHKFTRLAAELSRFKVKSAVLDGEAVVAGKDGNSNFSALQAALSADAQEAIEVYFFDLLALDGRDYAGLKLRQRVAALEKLLQKNAAKSSHIHLSEHLEGGKDILATACKLGAEGIVSKDIESLYRARRTRDWVKSKCGQEQEFVIGGFTPATNNPKAVGSLHLGYYKAGTMRYAGKVGTGFTHRQSTDLYRLLKPLEIKNPPFAITTRGPKRDNVWVEPETLCEVSFWEWTAEGHIRHASFKGIRFDKTPEQVKQEIPEKPPKAAGKREKNKAEELVLQGVTITHPERLVYPEDKITKGEVAQYFYDAIPYIMPFLKDRPVSLVRCTDNIAGECFFQRGFKPGMQDHIMPVTLSYRDKKGHYIYTQTPEGLMEMVQINAIELHPWGARVQDIDHPDYIIFDLDPGEGVMFDAIKLAAKDLRQRLAGFGLKSFARLSGGKGIHVVVPLTGNDRWKTAKDFAGELAKTMAREVPEAYVANMRKDLRGGKIFIDYFRNDYTATAIVPFGLRARAGAPIAVPVDWRELDKMSSASEFTIRTIRKRLNKKTEKMIEAFFACRQQLPSA